METKEEVGELAAERTERSARGSGTRDSRAIFLSVDQSLLNPGRVEEMQAVIDRLTEENAKFLEQGKS